MANAKAKEDLAPLSNGGSPAISLSKEDMILEQLGIEIELGRKYMFELVDENPDREYPVIDMREKRNMPKKKHKPFRNMVLTSQIVWGKSRTIIRYYDGCETIFASDQPKDKDAIDQYIKQTAPRNFLNGLIGIHADEKMLLVYALACSWNAHSPYKTRTSDSVFVARDENMRAISAGNEIDRQEKALTLAKEATKKKMRIHANYLQIATVDWDSGNEYTDDAIRAEYRKYALQNPKTFIDSYNDSSLELKYNIDKALEQGVIKFDNNKITWKTGTVIGDSGGMRSHEGISAELMKISQTVEGEEFVIQLNALFTE